MKVKITGSSGYLGKLIQNELINNGHLVSGVDRKILYGPVEDLQNEIRNTNVIIHLSGAPILQRWTKKNKSIILESRVKTTENLVEAINNLPPGERPEKFISASAVGIYKPGSVHDEESTNFDEGFVGEVVKKWESSGGNLNPAVQRIVLRIGLVLGKNAKTITGLLLPFKMGLGATIGNGKQPFPFIHEKDVAQAFVWATTELNKNGIFNLVAPAKITNRQFTKSLAQSVKRIAFLFVPVFMLKLILGEASSLLTTGATVEPKNLQKEGFIFQFPTIESALQEIIQ